jgi:hypothetical protein
VKNVYEIEYLPLIEAEIKRRNMEIIPSKQPEKPKGVRFQMNKVKTNNLPEL